MNTLEVDRDFEFVSDTEFVASSEQLISSCQCGIQEKAS